MPSMLSLKAYLYKSALEAHKLNILNEYINSLTNIELKELKYYVMSSDSKINKPIIDAIYKRELKHNNHSYQRVYK